MKVVFRAACAALLAGLFVADSIRADIRVFLSETGPPVLAAPGDPSGPYIAQPPLEVCTRPEVLLNLGEQKTFGVWLQFDPSPPDSFQTLIGIGLDVETSDVLVATLTEFEVANPTVRDANVARWTASFDGHRNSTDPTLWVANALGLAIQGNPGIVNDVDRSGLDTGFDATSGSYLFGELTFHAAAPGQFGLYFRVGLAGAVISPRIPAELVFCGGNLRVFLGNEFEMGNEIDPSLAHADATIQVIPEPVAGVVLCFGLAIWVVWRWAACIRRLSPSKGTSP